MHATAHLRHNPYEPGFQNPYRRDSRRGQHPTFGVGEAEGEDDPAAWGTRPYDPQAVYAGSRRARPLMRRLERTPFSRAISPPGGAVSGGRRAGGLGDLYVSPRTLAKQWHPNRSWSSKAGQGRTGFPHLPAAARQALLHGNPEYGAPGGGSKDPMAANNEGTWDDVVPGEVAAHLVDMDKMCVQVNLW